MYEQGEIVIVPFPFSDQTGKKLRPVIVISNNEFNKYSEDILVVGVTLNIFKDRYTVFLENKDIEEGKLLAECCVKCENILKIDKEIVIKKIGKIKKETFDLVRNIILEIIK